MNALLVHVQNQQNSGVYNPTEAEEKFHDWAANIVKNPTLPSVDSKLIEKVIQAYNESANHGQVPLELKNTDAEFWSNVVADKACEYNEDCETVGPQLRDPICEFVNCAYGATMSIGHLLTIEMEVTKCWGGPSCSFQDSKRLVGPDRLMVHFQLILAVLSKIVNGLLVPAV